MTKKSRDYRATKRLANNRKRLEAIYSQLKPKTTNLVGYASQVYWASKTPILSFVQGEVL